MALLIVSMPAFAGAISTSEAGSLGQIDVPRAGDKSITWEGGAEAFARRFAPKRGGSGAEAFKARRVFEDEIGQVHVRLSQTIAGLPVAGVELIVHADRKSGKVIGVNGNFAADRLLPVQPELGGRVAIDQALAELGIRNAVIGEPKLTYVIDDLDEVVLAWVSLVRQRDSNEEDLVYANARTGAAVRRDPQQAYAKSRQVNTCSNGTALPCTPVLYEGGSNGDLTVMAAYNNAGTFWDYFKNVHNRDSWNGSGATIVAAVHYGVLHTNAAWNNSNQLAWFGDGDGVLYDVLAYSRDVVVHEYTHGITFSETNMPYNREPGAINESLSDIFAAATTAWVQGGTLNSNVWRFAEDVYTPNNANDALRLMSDPAAEGHPDYYPERSLVSTETHANAGPSNLAFYLLVAGGQHPRGDTTNPTTAIGMDAASKIFYRALTVKATAGTNYRLMRKHTLDAAVDLHGLSSTQYVAVSNAWTAVGNSWSEGTATLANTASFTHPSYSSTISGIHTGQLDGPDGTNFNLFLEKLVGGVWTEVAEARTSRTDETIEYSGGPGSYRWRVHALTGAGTYTHYWNKPK